MSKLNNKSRPSIHYRRFFFNKESESLSLRSLKNLDFSADNMI